MEYPFQPTAEFEFRYADVAFVAKERLKSVPDDGYLQGAPDLIVEIMSPPNTWDEIQDKRSLCLRNGCASYWIVDPKLQSIQVSESETCVRVYKLDNSIPLPFHAGAIPVRAIFEK